MSVKEGSVNNELAKKLMEVLIAEGVAKKISSQDLQVSEDTLQDSLAVLTNVSARITAAFLLNAARSAPNPGMVEEAANNIVTMVAFNFDQMVTAEMAIMVEGIKDLVEAKKATSH